MVILDEFIIDDICATKELRSDDKEREEESYANEFVDLVFQDDDDDFGNRINLGSHKEHPENDDDDDENEKEKKDEKKVNDNNVITVHPTTNSLTATPSFVDLQHQLYLKMKRSIQDQADDLELWEVLKLSYVDEVIPENDSPELIKEFQNVDKHVPTIQDHERMEATLRDMI
nr:hypothetical protein [Tanacetum cinerariifolium]